MRLLNFFKSIFRAFVELFIGKPKSNTGNKLRDFLIDLSNDENLQEKYANNPERVMESYSLSEDEKHWIRDADTEAINQHIGESYFSITWIHVSRK